MSAMDTFLADFELGKQQGRYIAGELPALPFANGQFDDCLVIAFSVFVQRTLVDRISSSGTTGNVTRCQRGADIFRYLR